MALRIAVPYNSSERTKAKPCFKETFVFVYFEFNLSDLVISISDTHNACELINPYCAIATFINLSLVQ